MNNFEIIIVGIGVLGLAILVFFLRPSKKYISEDTFHQVKERLEKTKNLSPAHVILESHKIFISTLNSLQKQKGRSAAKRISLFADRFSNTKKIKHWNHKRNQIAHEENIATTKIEAENARKDFLQALTCITKKSKKTR